MICSAPVVTGLHRIADGSQSKLPFQQRNKEVVATGTHDRP